MDLSFNRSDRMLCDCFMNVDKSMCILLFKLSWGALKEQPKYLYKKKKLLEAEIETITKSPYFRGDLVLTFKGGNPQTASRSLFLETDTFPLQKEGAFIRGRNNPKWTLASHCKKSCSALCTNNLSQNIQLFRDG